MPSTKTRHYLARRSMAIFLGLAAALFVLAFSFPKDSMIDVFERNVYDLWFLLQGEGEEREDILVMGITTDDLKHVGPWPWSKADLAYLIDMLSRYKPAAIVFDILFTEHEGGWDVDRRKLDSMSDGEKRQIAELVQARETIIEQQQLAEQDFIRAIREAGNVYLASYLDYSGQSVSELDQATLDKRLEKLPQLSIHSSATPHSFPEDNIPEAGNYILPLESFQDVSAGVGFINVQYDSDGVLRKTSLIGRYSEYIFPSLDLVVVGDYLEVPPEAMRIVPGRSISFQSNGIKYRIPVDSAGRARIKFKGPETYLRNGISVTGFIVAANGGDAPFSPEIVSGKIVLIGELVEGVSGTDSGAVPAVPYYPLVGVHATVIDNVLSRSHIYDFPAWLTLVLLLMIGLALGLVLPLLRTWMAILVVIILLAASFVVPFLAFRYASVWVPAIKPALTIGVGFGLILVYDLITEQRQRRYIHEVFGRCVDRTVVDRIVESGIDPELGGNRREVTVLFADIRGFTPYTEQHEAEEVVETLNQYFTAMNEVIFERGGTIDKYMGDAIMVFFGDPMPMPNHCLEAVLTALEMEKRMEALRTEWGDQGFSQGIGINTGEVVVGWMGSPSKKEYTVIGNTVNTAFRIESVAGAGQVLISESTYQKVKEFVQVRQLEPVRLKGIKELQTLYQVMGVKDSLKVQTDRKT